MLQVAPLVRRLALLQVCRITVCGDYKLCNYRALLAPIYYRLFVELFFMLTWEHRRLCRTMTRLKTFAPMTPLITMVSNILPLHLITKRTWLDTLIKHGSGPVRLAPLHAVIAFWPMLRITTMLRPLVRLTLARKSCVRTARLTTENFLPRRLIVIVRYRNVIKILRLITTRKCLRNTLL